ncbi:probable ubiquitin carboxyl-terminal hydrolase FAF-Y [Nephila pilipes]|uniref:Probable ubiquitin carboxyl-terminal hydrolase FAF-Y n=1 Tax=Nephila pilipes TaxID=299642 RepID=A0A8X6UEE2_NEPPI|nr:probable ubiquitin carboxyl-terminal hydrolase FAF-Y [Nephila pilipes]
MQSDMNLFLSKRPYPTNAQYGYNNWSPPAQSNETSNGQFLERSHSARITLAKAFELCPDEDIEDQEASEDEEEIIPPEDKSWQESDPTPLQDIHNPVHLTPLNVSEISNVSTVKSVPSNSTEKIAIHFYNQTNADTKPKADGDFDFVTTSIELKRTEVSVSKMTEISDSRMRMALAETEVYDPYTDLDSKLARCIREKKLRDERRKQMEDETSSSTDQKSQVSSRLQKHCNQNSV